MRFLACLVSASLAGTTTGVLMKPTSGGEFLQRAPQTGDHDPTAMEEDPMEEELLPAGASCSSSDASDSSASAGGFFKRMPSVKRIAKGALGGLVLAALGGTCYLGGQQHGGMQTAPAMADTIEDDALMGGSQPFGHFCVRTKFPRFGTNGRATAVDAKIEGPITVPVTINPDGGEQGGAWTEGPGAGGNFDFPSIKGKPEVGFGGKLLGTVLSMDLKKMGRIPCGCQTNFYLTKAPKDNSPGTCDSGANGYGCPELDFMEGNGQALGTTLHLCDSTEGARGVFTCGWQDSCLTSKLGGKKPGGAACDAWGCQTKTVGMKHWGKAAYGHGGYINSDEDFNMQVYFQPVAGNLENVWVKLSQGTKEPLVYSACVNEDYKHAVTHDLMSGWSHHSTYWGGFDGMEWLNGPCPQHPSHCAGNAADHIQNVKVIEIDQA
ncbi:unnamed protein product [Amoebophrya sp. A25]|nr:unnamed protein product [Amoebophrya sp. A25]|eukprot:GSA25T00008276001.1